MRFLLKLIQRRKSPAIVCLATVIGVLLTGHCRAELQPAEIAILGVSGSARSRELAEHYATVRGVPASQILLVDCPMGVELDRRTWDTAVRPRILAWLREKQLETRIRCMVLSWDVPLRISRRSVNAPEMIAGKEYLSGARVQQLQEIGVTLAVLESLAKDQPTPATVSIPTRSTQRELAERVGTAIRQIQVRLRELKSNSLGRKQDLIYETMLLRAGGIDLFFRLQLRPGTEPTPPLMRLRGQLEGLQDGLRALQSLPEGVARDMQLIALQQKALGSLGALNWIESQQQALQQNETYASFESELSLLYWPEYSLLRWQPNLLYYGYDALSSRRATLMVSRLAAPRFEQALRLADVAVEVEKTGLEGKVYIDARGMSYSPQTDKLGSFGSYDQSLRELAARLRQFTKLDVVVDDKPELFAPGACRDAALYCGWYSLGNYVDSFTWRPGAVGYHMASMEAETLTTPGAKVWCNAMLERGVAATLGPVYEPHLLAFPLPDDFFSLLLTGECTLVETYYRTNPFNSWVLVLVGDPLYNPFRQRPALVESNLPERLRPKSVLSVRPPDIPDSTPAK